MVFYHIFEYMFAIYFPGMQVTDLQVIGHHENIYNLNIQFAYIDYKQINKNSNLNLTKILKQ